MHTINYYAHDGPTRPRGEGGNKRCLSVRPSVCPSVAYVANNLRTQRSSVPKFGRTVTRLRCNSHTSFKVKRSKVRVTRPINADTRHVSYIPNGMAYETNFRLGIRMEDDDPHQPQASWPPRSKVEVTRSRDQSEPCLPMAHKSKANSRSITKRCTWYFDKVLRRV